MKNRKLGALSAVVLLCCQLTSATTLVVLVCQDSVVLGGDGKGVDVESHGTEPIEKVVIVNVNVLVSSMGIGDLLSKDGTINYTFASWIHTLPVRRDAGAKEVALAIREASWSIFKNFPVDFSNGQDPLVRYYVAGTEFPGPSVYMVAIRIDWHTRQPKKPTVELLYPTEQNVRIFIRWHGPDEGGIAALMQTGSAVQTKYLKLFPNIV